MIWYSLGFWVFFFQCRSNPVLAQVSQSNVKMWNSVWVFDPLLRDHHGSLDLFEWDKHHNVPRSQPQKRGHKSARNTKRVCNLYNDLRTPKLTSMSGPERKCSPFVESRRPLFCHHGPGTVDSALVLAWWGVHVPSFHHIYRGSDHCGNKACAKRRNKVAGQVVCGDKKKPNNTRVWMMGTRGPLFSL